MAAAEPSHDLFQTLLFVPGNRPRLLEKAGNQPVDAVVLDLEDSVPDEEKPTARTLIADALAGAARWQAAAFVRVNPVESELVNDDLAAVVRPGLRGVMLPKVESPEQIAIAEALVSQWEAERGLGTGEIGLLATIETAAGLLAAPAVARASRRIIALVFGGEDFTLDLGTSRSKDGIELLCARSNLVVAATAAKVQAIDTVWTDLDDQDGLRREAELVRQLGFSGKMLIHPKQIEPIELAFAPSPEEITRAREIVEAYTLARAEGRGTVAVRGQMIDAPVVARARRVLERAERGLGLGTD